ncbi:MAG: hypothetical protein HOF62_06100 [Gammaproteobacteria bacterium]|nr:hypothetical protein [Gammaproteobacteria bacterium]
MNPIKQNANDLLSQYGDDAESIAMLRAAEFAASLNIDEWKIWEAVIDELRAISFNPEFH